MNGFRFRAQAALDLRQREYDEAARRDAAAQAAERGARAAKVDAEEALAAALRRADGEAVTGATPHAWHRNWIVGLQHEIARRDRVLQDREMEAADARERARVALRRVRSLEQFRHRQSQAYEAEARRQEQRGLDEFASIRFTARRMNEEGQA